jgi:hypothetical protein
MINTASMNGGILSILYAKAPTIFPRLQNYLSNVNSEYRVGVKRKKRKQREAGTY